MVDALSTAADYRSDSLSAIDFDIPCAMVWGYNPVVPRKIPCDAAAVADLEFIGADTSEISQVFACAGCVARVKDCGRFVRARYF